MGGFGPRLSAYAALAGVLGLAGLGVPGPAASAGAPAAEASVKDVVKTPGKAPAVAPAKPSANVMATAQANFVKGVKPFSLDIDSGSMALRALASCLEASGNSVSYNRLVGLSGAAFKFVYDTTEAYEPLRDLYPTDVLKNAAVAAGFPDAHWELDRPIDEVKRLVKSEIDRGRPVIAPYIKPDGYRGFYIIAGYNYIKGDFGLQGASQDTNYAAVAIPTSWSGPTASPMGWAANPVFVVGAHDPARAPGENLDQQTVEMAIQMLKGGKLKYGLTPGEQPFLGHPGEREAVYGLPAYTLLGEDVASAPLVVTSDGVEGVNFAFLWRLDAQLGQLVSDRKYASITLDFISTRMMSGKSIDVEVLADNVDRTVTDVVALRQMFSNQIPYDLRTAPEIAAYVQASKAIVLSFAGRDKLMDELKGLGLQAYRTRWGPAIVSDSPEKRLAARLLVKSITSREHASLRMLEGILEYVGPDLQQQPAPGQTQEQPAGRRRRGEGAGGDSNK